MSDPLAAPTPAPSARATAATAGDGARDGAGVQAGAAPREGGTPPMSTWMPAGEYVHLLYLFNLLWQPLFDDTATWVDWAIVVGVIVTFVPVYVLAHHPDPRRRWQAPSRKWDSRKWMFWMQATRLSLGSSAMTLLR